MTTEIVVDNGKPAIVLSRSKMRIGRAIRQGDVLVQRISEIPAGCVARRRRDLAVGVRTSHIACDPAQTFEREDDEAIYIESASPWRLAHDEHGEFVLPAGRFKSWTQREFAHIAGRVEERRVRD